MQMDKVLNFIYDTIKKVIITIILLPLAIILGILMYSEALFVVIFYLWVNPKKSEELWMEFKKGLKEIKDGKRKVNINKKYYFWVVIALLLLIFGYFYGK
jgi:lysylphosphatidylglycerol synthetase-like protein (DUF2156 family)